MRRNRRAIRRRLCKEQDQRRAEQTTPCEPQHAMLVRHVASHNLPHLTRKREQTAQGFKTVDAAKRRQTSHRFTPGVASTVVHVCTGPTISSISVICAAMSKCPRPIASVRSRIFTQWYWSWCWYHEIRYQTRGTKHQVPNYQNKLQPKNF